MKDDLYFFKAMFPESRKADFYLGCFDGAVFFDFDCTEESRICLKRISFDGYGCCNILNQEHCLDAELSKKFLNEIKKDVLNQMNIKHLVFKLIALNQAYIWQDALNEYHLMVS